MPTQNPRLGHPPPEATGLSGFRTEVSHQDFNESRHILKDDPTKMKKIAASTQLAWTAT